MLLKKSENQNLANTQDSLSVLQIWFTAARPKTLGAAIAPVMLGGSLGMAFTGQFVLAPVISCLLGALLLQILSNFANDYFDYKKGKDTSARVGPLRVMQAGLVSDRQMQMAMLLVVQLSVINGLYLISIAGLPILIVGLLGILFAVLYTAGPKPLAYIGLGDIFVFLFFGLIATAFTAIVVCHKAMPALQYQELLHKTPLPHWLVFGSLVGFISTAILVVNNIRDYNEDRITGKNTLIVKLGLPFGHRYYQFLVIAPLVVSIILALGYWVGFASLKIWSFGFLSALLIPLVYQLIHTMSALKTGPQLIPLLGATGRYLILFSLINCIGVLLA